MRIAVYGGSFNPLHIGHLEILGNLAGLFDRVLLVVSPWNPLKESGVEEAERRLEAAREALSRHPELAPSVEVSDVEFNLPLPSYTINTLDELKRLYPGDEIVLIVGGDQIANFRRWRDYSRILLEYGVAAFPRPGYDRDGAVRSLLEEDPRYRVYPLEMELMDISSSEIRSKISRGEDVSNMLM
ncbi:MAG: nicotinate (nicotinamide) nucleotide adenylyltransferase [Bacteroidales bacterium]|nr:nicotinate (nicotinamide) nucleotide adenylyltransferase [Bacteroidales bacterium]